MTRQEAIERFTAKLTTTIGDFFDGLFASHEEESAYSEMKLNRQRFGATNGQKRNGDMGGVGRCASVS